MSNPWQQQANANKNAAGTTPPWMKNNANQQQQGPPKPPATQPWMKNNAQQPSSQPQQPKTQPPTQQSPPPPPPTQTNNNSSGNVPPWMKNKPPGNTAPGQPGQGVPPPNTANKSGGMPWMKNKDSGNTSKISEQISEIQKQEESILKEDKEEMKILEPEIKIDDSEKSKQILIEEKQEEEQKSPEKQKKSKVKAPPKQKKTPKKPKQIKNDSAFHKYINLLAASFDTQNSEYEDRLQSQENLIKHLNQFAQQCKQSLQQYIKDRKITQRKNNFLLLKNDTLFCKYALVYTTNSSGKKQSKFKTEQIQQLELIFRMYSAIFSVINKIVKKVGNRKFRLRAPMLSYVQYKGIEFMCEAICDQLTDVINSPAENHPQIQTEMNIFEKQLAEYFEGMLIITRKNFYLKKLAIKEDNDQLQYFILYLNESSFDFSNINYETSLHFLNPQLKSEPSLYNSTTLVPLSPVFLSDIQNFATNIDSINYLDFAILSKKALSQQARQKQKDVEEFEEMRRSFCLAQGIKIIYGSCQGELEDETFWQLIFEGNNAVWEMVNMTHMSKSSGIDKKKVHLYAEFLERLLPIKFNRKYIKKLKPMNPISSLQGRSHLYPFQFFQIMEICQLFNKYMTSPSSTFLSSQHLSNTVQLAQKSLEYQKKVKQASEHHIISDFTFFKNETIFLLNTMQFKAAVKKIKKQLKQNEDKGSLYKKIGLDLLLLLCYLLAEDNQKENKAQQNNKDDRQKKKEKQQQNKEGKEDKDQKQGVDKQEKEGSRKEQKQSEDEQRNDQEDYQLELLQRFSQLLESVKKLLGTENQIWFHANIYMIIASYYSKKIVNAKKKIRQLNESDAVQSHLFADSQLLKNGQKNTDPEEQEMALNEAINRYFSTSLKFMNHALNLTLEIYGNMSAQFAKILYEKAYLHYLTDQYEQAENILQKAIEIYKKSSRHHRYTLECLFLKGRIGIENDKSQEAQTLLETIGKQFIDIDCVQDAISVYEYLYANAPKPLSFSIHSPTSYNPQQYLEKQFELCLGNKIPSRFKQLCFRLLSAQIKMHTSEKFRILQKLFQNVEKEKEEEQMYQNVDEIIFELWQNYRGYGNCIEMIRMSISVVLNNKNTQSSQYQKAEDILKSMIALFQKEQFLKLQAY